MNIPDSIQPVPISALEELARLAPSFAQGGKPRVRSGEDASFDVSKWLADHSLAVANEKPWEGGQMWVLEKCPWNEAHTNKSAFIVKFQNGGIMAKCHHDSCTGKTWHDLREKYEPGYKRQSTSSHVSQADRLLSLCDGCEFFRGTDQAAYVRIVAPGSPSSVWRVMGEDFQLWLTWQYHSLWGGAVNPNLLRAAVNTLAANAHHSGAKRDVSLRVAERDGKVFIDLCNDAWECVMIDAAGWEVTKNCQILFRRSPSMRALPQPVRGESLSRLREFIRVDDRGWALLASWLVAAMWPNGPFPILSLCAEPGSAKSTTAKLLRSLCDPNQSPLRAEPRTMQDLLISADNSWCIALDNLSHLTQQMSDALCRMSTGGGIAGRKLYRDNEEIVIDAKRPVIITSISDVAVKSDLLSRCLLVELPRISKDARETEADLWARFEELRPAFFGALLDCVATALRELPSTLVPYLPRLADFAKLAVAAEAATTGKAGLFLEAFEASEAAANEVALEASPIYKALKAALANAQGRRFEGTATELLDVLNKPEHVGKRPIGWPKTARTLSSQLRAIGDNLRNLGWVAHLDRTHWHKVWHISLPEEVGQRVA